MQLRTFVILVAVSLIGLVGMVSAKSVTPMSLDKTDPISGQWTGTFLVEGNSVTVTFDFKLEGDKLTGTLESAHTGAGTVKKGQWAHNKLAFTAEFASHESIEMTGTIKDGKLVGEFHTEGRVGKWEATKK